LKYTPLAFTFQQNAYLAIPFKVDTAQKNGAEIQASWTGSRDCLLLSDSTKCVLAFHLKMGAEPARETQCSHFRRLDDGINPEKYQY
jgi:hypothetical protein